MMASFQIELGDDGSATLAGLGSDLDRVEAVVRWHADRAKVATKIHIRQEHNSPCGDIRVEIEPESPADEPAVNQLVCSLHRQFRESPCYRCSRRWLRGSAWGWLISHVPGEEW